MSKSRQHDVTKINDVVLTLATWDSGYGPSFEIGWRKGDEFYLIQWDRIGSATAWDVVKRLVAKNKHPQKITKILNRIAK